MKNLRSMASILYYAFTVMLCLSVLALVVIVAAFAILSALDLPLNTLQLSPAVFKLNTEALNITSHDTVFVTLAEALNMAAGSAFAAVIFGKLRSMLRLIKDGKPFAQPISKILKSLGNITLIYSICSFILQGISSFALAHFINKFGHIFQNEYITSINVSSTANAHLIWVALLLYLLAYIFDYGQQLQKLSDETL